MFIIYSSLIEHWTNLTWLVKHELLALNYISERPSLFDTKQNEYSDGWAMTTFLMLTVWKLYRVVYRKCYNSQHLNNATDKTLKGRLDLNFDYITNCVQYFWESATLNPKVQLTLFILLQTPFFYDAVLFYVQF